MAMNHPTRLFAVTPVESDRLDTRLRQLIERGLPVTPHPYRDIAGELGISEQQVVDRIQHLIENGQIKRYGVVVRHRQLGYRANGMVVWNIDDLQVAELGRRIGEFPCVTLSYRRPRRLPAWPYNLFTMVHGRSRHQVMQYVREIMEHCDLQQVQHEILFSTHCFKQRGARYTRPSKPPVNLTLLKSN